MKLLVVAAAASQVNVASAASLFVGSSPRRQSLRSVTHSTALVARSAPTQEHAHFGDTACPCIGFDNIDGQTAVELSDGREVTFPADLGARCEKWDNDVHPDCKAGAKPGKDNGWCGQAWCLVDACHCSLPVLPKTSSYVPDARFRGRPLFYSYHTCGGEDMWMKQLPQVGSPGCRCIAFSNLPGTTEVGIRTKGLQHKQLVEFPAELGGTCKSWDDEMHPECKGPNKPSWCEQRWCYVDPCACNIVAPPKITMYLPKATFTGKSLYYSYETCGSNDTFTASRNVEACVNQKDEKKCLSLKVRGGVQKCAWTGKCLGAELVSHPLCTHLTDNEKQEKSGAGRATFGDLNLLLAIVALAGFASK